MLRVSFYFCNMMYYTLNVVFQCVFPGLLGQWKLFAHISCWPVLSRNNISRFAQWNGAICRQRNCSSPPEKIVENASHFNKNLAEFVVLEGIIFFKAFTQFSVRDNGW